MDEYDDAEEVKRELDDIEGKPQPKKSTPKKPKEENEMKTDPVIFISYLTSCQFFPDLLHI